MKIADYLKYYIGAPCSFGSEANGWIAVLDDVGGCSVKLNGVPKLEYVSQDDVRPILRKLKDMTEEDAKGLLSLINPSAIYNSHNELAVYYSAPGVSSGYYPFDYGYPKQFHYLLSRGYDIFGLIPAGIAIDAKTLNTPDNGDKGQ